jgi:carboxypeptidase D
MPHRNKKSLAIITLLFSFFISFFSTPLFASPHLLNYLYYQQKVVGPHYLKIDMASSHLSIADILKTGIIIDHYSGGKMLRAYATDEDLKILHLLQIPYELITEKKIKESDTRGYLTHEQITQVLFDLENKYPHLIKISSIGKSVQGRDIWSVKISNNPAIDLPKCEINLKSTMHGDEVVGQEILIKLIDYLLTHYDSDPRIHKLIDRS